MFESVLEDMFESYMMSDWNVSWASWRELNALFGAFMAG